MKRFGGDHHYHDELAKLNSFQQFSGETITEMVHRHQLLCAKCLKKRGYALECGFYKPPNGGISLK